MRLSHLMGCLYLQANRGAITPMRIDTPASGKGAAEFSQCLQQVSPTFWPHLLWRIIVVLSRCLPRVCRQHDNRMQTWTHRD